MSQETVLKKEVERLEARVKLLEKVLSDLFKTADEIMSRKPPGGGK